MVPPWAPESKYRPAFRTVLVVAGLVWVWALFTDGPRWISRYVGPAVIISQALVLGMFKGLGDKVRDKFDPRYPDDRS